MYAIADDKKIDTSGVVSYKIMVEGEDVSTQCQLESFGIEIGANSIAKANIVLMDGSIPKRDFELSNGNHFVPGSRIEILCGYKMLDKKIFSGIMVSQSISFTEEGTRLEVDCKSKTYQMTMGRKNKIYYDMSDSDIIESLLQSYGLDADVASTATVYSEFVQNGSTDWDFIAMRAQHHGMIIWDNGEKVTVQKPDTSKDEIQTLIMSDTLLEAELRLNSENQHKSYAGRTWNFSDQEVIELDASAEHAKEPGNLSNTRLGDIADNSEMIMVSKTSQEQSLLQDWVDAKQIWQELSKITGVVKVQGSEKYQLGEMVKIEGLGNRFNGSHLISQIHHSYELGNWFSFLQLGIEPEWFAERFKDVNELPASGLIPCIHGLHIGIVTALEGDPSGEHRIHIQLPMVDKDSEGVWARYMAPYAGEEYGIHFLPEIGTEVLLGFLNDDPNQAVVLGGLNSNTHTAPEPISDDNFKKIIKTKSGITICIDDDKKVFSIETPAGNLIELNEDSQEINIIDFHSNKINMSSDGITLESAKDIVLSATGDVKIEGINLESKATASYKAEGQAGLEISSSANTVIKGSIVQIN